MSEVEKAIRVWALNAGATQVLRWAAEIAAVADEACRCRDRIAELEDEASSWHCEAEYLRDLANQAGVVC